MAQETYALGGSPRVTINTCGGNLEIAGQEIDRVAVKSGRLQRVAQVGDQLAIEQCDDDLSLALPRGTTLVMQRAGGDARVDGLAAMQLGDAGGDLSARFIEGACTVGRVGGDLRATDVGMLAIQTVHGNARIERVTGGAEIARVDGDLRVSDVANLALGAVGGNAHLEGLAGVLRLDRAGGDATVRGAVDGFTAAINGDLTLDIAYTSGHEYRLDVHGDAKVLLPADAGLTLHATVAGDVKGIDGTRLIPGDSSTDGGSIRAAWGDGRARLTLYVDGNLSMRETDARGRTDMPAPAQMNAAGWTDEAVPVEANAATDPTVPIGSTDTELSVLEAVARGDLSPAEADDLLSRPREK